MTAKVLFVDDDPEVCEWASHVLRRRGLAAVSRTRSKDALALLGTDDFDVVVADLMMPAPSGLELCERIVANRDGLPVIAITGFGNLELAIAAIRAGAYDFLAKPFADDALLLAIDRAVEHRRLRAEVRRLRSQHAADHDTHGFLGAAASTLQLRAFLARIAAADSSVLVTGESGTGKEVAARFIHHHSPRKAGPFVAINCAAMPESLLEAELFGHARGAFTDARTSRVGLFHQASGGTLLLDELGDMPIGLQPKLLRALEGRTARPVGGDAELPFDARIIATTNRDLQAAVDAGRFREDLFYRINVIHVTMPPLRDRPGDVLTLAQAFITELARRADKPIRGMSVAVAERLVSYSWPGNVRELRNCIERAVALTEFEELTADDLPDRIRRYPSSHVVVAADDPPELVSLEEIERRYILRVLDTTQGSKAQAARILGLDRATLYRKLDRYLK